MRAVLVIGMIGLTINCYSQVVGFDKYPFDYFKPKKLHPAPFKADEKVFVYIKNEVKIYFKQADIRAHIIEAVKRDSANSKNGKLILDLLDQELNEIEIEDGQIGFSNKTIDNLQQKGVNFGMKKVNFIFSLIAADLMYEDKFMVFDKTDKKAITKGLEGDFRDFFGSKMYAFLLPNGKTFYSIVLTN